MHRQIDLNYVYCIRPFLVLALNLVSYSSIIHSNETEQKLLFSSFFFPNTDVAEKLGMILVGFQGGAPRICLGFSLFNIHLFDAFFLK